MSRLEALYQARRAHPWSINEHMDTLRRYGRECRRIVEFGTHVGFSTIAFLAAGPEQLDCYDIQRQEVDLALIEAIAREECPTRFQFHCQDCLTAEFAACDLLFIDDLHDYQQVKQELERFAGRVDRYLIFHDTVGRATTDETPSHRPLQGVGTAVGEFMAAHPEWERAEHFEHQYGLTIYRRIGERGP